MVKNIYATGCLLTASFSLEIGTIININCLEMNTSLELKRDNVFYLKVVECVGSNNLFDINCEFVGLSSKVTTLIKDAIATGKLLR